MPFWSIVICNDTLHWAYITPTCDLATELDFITEFDFLPNYTCSYVEINLS